MDTFNPNQMPPVPLQHKSNGPLIAVIIILALIIIGGLYFLGKRASQETYVPPPTTQGDSDNVVASLQTQSSSDDVTAIETDLNADNFDNIDQGAAALQYEMQ